MTDRSTPPNRVPWPPLVLAACLFLSLALTALLPLPLRVLPPAAQAVAGALVAICGVGLDLWAMARLRAGRTTIMPNRASSRLVVRGPYRFSRNPIYLGNTILLAGIGVALGSLWFVLLAIAGAWITQKLAIEPEERHLGRLFGAEFDDYRRRVRRWL